MENVSLYNYFILAQQEDNDAKLYLYNRFLPIIKYYGTKLPYGEGETDITIFFLEFIKNFKLNKFKNRSNGEIYNYVKISIKGNFLNTIKKINNQSIKTVQFEDNFTFYDNHNNLEIFNFIITTKKLDNLEKNILIGKYILDLTDIELLKMLNITRTTLYKHKKIALTAIKEDILDFV